MQMTQEAIFAKYGRACLELDQLRALTAQQQARIAELESANAELSNALKESTRTIDNQE